MSRDYAPNFVHKHAIEIYKEFKQKHTISMQDEEDFICLKLANLEDEESFFTRLDTIHASKDIEDFLFYDIVLVERNLYLPVAIFWGLFFLLKLGKTRYIKYIEKGAILGILHKYGYTPVEIKLHFFGTFASVHARKDIKEKK